MPRKSDRAPVNRLAYRVDEASEASGVGRSKLYEEIKGGRLRSVKVGGRRLILHDDLVAILGGNTESEARHTAESAASATPTGKAQAHDLSPAWTPKSSSRRGRFLAACESADLKRRTDRV